MPGGPGGVGEHGRKGIRVSYIACSLFFTKLGGRWSGELGEHEYLASFLGSTPQFFSHRVKENNTLFVLQATKAGVEAWE